MATKFLKDPSFAEQYVLNQMPEALRLEFEGAMFLDESLRNQVHQTKFILGSLQTLSQEPEFANPTPTPSSFNRKYVFIYGSILLLIIAVGYFIAQSSFVKQPEPQNIEQEKVPIATPPQENVEEEQPFAVPPPPAKKPDPKKGQIFAESPTTSEQPKVKDWNEENMEFAAPPFKEEEMVFAMADVPQRYDYNPYIEAVINDNFKSDALKFEVNFKDAPKSIDGYVSLNLLGNINQNPTGKFVFRLYSNDIIEFENNQFISEKSINFDDKSFELEWNIELNEGLYYLTIYKIYDNSDEEMVFANKFIID